MAELPWVQIPGPRPVLEFTSSRASANIYGETGSDYIDGEDGVDFADGGPDWDFCINVESSLSCEGP